MPVGVANVRQFASAVKAEAIHTAAAMTTDDN
jgi:hypothetical protein